MEAINDPQTQSTMTTASIPYIGNSIVGGQDDNSRILGRQIPSGNIRGNQTITGDLIINSPTSNSPVISISGTTNNILITDSDTAINQIVIGSLPDGTYGMVVSKSGIDVLTLFST